jgi:hypothetical protein
MMPEDICVSRSRIEATTLCRSLIGLYVLTTNILCAYMRINIHPKCGVWDELSSPFLDSILIWGSVWGFPSIIEISVRKFKIRLNSEVLVNSV